MRSVVLAGVLAGGLCLPPAAWAGRCDQLTRVSSTSATAVYSDLLDRPARVCSVDFIATAANGRAVVFDSPNDDDAHAQTRYISEPGAATAGDAVNFFYGEDGRPTLHGLDVLVENGTVIISWSGTAP